MRSVVGYLCERGRGARRKYWNDVFAERGYDAFFDVYHTHPCRLPACDVSACLHVRMSEALHLHRAGYVLADAFQEDALALMDMLDETANVAGRADTVVNEGGVLRGYFLGEGREADVLRCALWFASAPSGEDEETAERA